MQNTMDIKRSHNKGNTGIIIFLIIMASILGSIYGIYINLNNLEYTTVIYLWINNHQSEVSLVIVFNIWFKYFKRIFIVWASSFCKITYIIGYIVLFGVVFSVGFTFITLLMLWGKVGISVVILLCFIETIISTMMIIEILNKRECLDEKRKYIRKNVVILIKDILICIIMSLIDIYIINIMIL